MNKLGGKGLTTPALIKAAAPPAVPRPRPPIPGLAAAITSKASDIARPPVVVGRTDSKVSAVRAPPSVRPRTGVKVTTNASAAMKPQPATGPAGVSPVIAPPVADTVPIEVAKPSYTSDATDPYAADASWEPFPDASEAIPDEYLESPAKLHDDFVPLKSSIKDATIVQKSWIDRFLNWMGLSRKSVVSATMAGEAAAVASMSQVEAAAQLVRRAREGDQNAMATIACVREAAAKGNARAILSSRYMHEYVKRHPVPDGAETEFGIDEVLPKAKFGGSDPSTAAAVGLSHGPLLTGERVAEIVRLAKYSDEERSAFKHGLAGRYMRNPAEAIQKANHAGLLIRHARKLQAVRSPDVSVSRFDAGIGWELGEDIE